MTEYRFRLVYGGAVFLTLFYAAATGSALAQTIDDSAIAPAANRAMVNAALTPGASSFQDQNPQVPDAPVPQVSQRDKAAQQLRQQEHQRILGIIPNFNTTDVQDAIPLSPKQKFRLMFRSVTDPFAFFAAGFIAGYGQATNSHSGYGQGAAGYGKRYGAAYADSVDGALWGNAIFPTLLRQDPRYFRRGHGGFRRRFLYSLSTAVWSKNDNGKWGLNYSNVMGNIVAGGVSNLYYPSEDRGLELTFQGAVIITAEGALGSLGVEFWPDISHKFFHTPLPGTSTALPAPK